MKIRCIAYYGLLGREKEIIVVPDTYGPLSCSVYEYWMIELPDGEVEIYKNDFGDYVVSFFGSASGCYLLRDCFQFDRRTNTLWLCSFNRSGDPVRLFGLPVLSKFS